jgi:hypothetical protein
MANIEENEGQYDRFLMTEADMPEPPEGLHGRILRRVERARRRALVVKTTIFGLIFAGSASLVVVGYLNLMSAFAQSGFLNFASLFFSDFSVAMANFQDFMFSTLESFPVFSAAFLLGGVIAVIWSAAHFINDVREVRAHGNLAI